MGAQTEDRVESGRGPEPGKQVPQSFVDPADAVGRLDYLLYLPRDYGTGNAEWPLVLFLHGAGERGSDLDAVKRHGPPKLIEQGQDLPCIVASPQCPAQHWWVEEDFQRVLWELQMDLAERYAVDRDRVCLTGISMGGFGAWMLAARRPECFAALVPVCGGGDPAWAGRLREIGIWAFHGAEDNVVPLDFSVRMVESVRAAGGEVEFTIYPEVGHDSWTPTYENPDLWRWMLDQRRSGPARSRKPR